jgi:hypothetical protein
VLSGRVDESSVAVFRADRENRAVGRECHAADARQVERNDVRPLLPDPLHPHGAVARAGGDEVKLGMGCYTSYQAVAVRTDLERLAAHGAVAARERPANYLSARQRS